MVWPSIKEARPWEPSGYSSPKTRGRLADKKGEAWVSRARGEGTALRARPSRRRRAGTSETYREEGTNARINDKA